VQELKHGNYRVKYDVNKLLKNPDEGMARKEALFTRKGETLYAICPVFPDEKLVLKNVTAKPDAKVTLLGTDLKIEWFQKGDNVIIFAPKMNPSRMPCEHAYTFKVSKIN